ncbi:MAG TPA: sigma-70 family RNA polymerase sigma factor [Candidatus Rifleibacterium sp.]|nr:sigma-70 family RNA polymerase sigma factor [Candidatus Rifleibacterium sp.]HPT45080.1 sigma-70 family RNA polymerase sigma factor [Candidatus Rifleibacterium sp.]
MENMKPEELWQQALTGSQPAWQKLYELFGSRVYQFFLKNTRNADLAADKVQEVFLRIFKNRDSFKYGSLKTWIFRIARNLLIDEWRRAGQREVPSDTLPDIVDAGVQVEESVIDAIEHRQMAGFIDECLDKLEEGDRLAICLVYIAGLSIPEFAEVMELPPGTAKTRVRHARLKLDSLLSEKLQIDKYEKSL